MYLAAIKAFFSCSLVCVVVECSSDIKICSNRLEPVDGLPISACGNLAYLQHYSLAPAPPDPVEGTWKLIQCENYEKYLEKIGTGPLSVNMVMRANVVLTITQVPTSSLQPRTVTVLL